MPDEIQPLQTVNPADEMPAPVGSLNPPVPEITGKGSESASASFASSLDATQANVKRGRGRPPKDRSLDIEAGQTPKEARKEILQKQSQERKAKCAQVGEISAKMVLGAIASFGPDYALDFANPAEKQAADMAISSTSEYFVHMDWADMPPTIGLMVSWAMVGFVIANKPANKPKVAALWERIKAKIQNWKADKASKG